MPGAGTAVSVLLASLGVMGTAAAATTPTPRWQAPITIERPAAFVVLPLPASTYAHSETPALADLRLTDAQGQRVPFAFLPSPPAATPPPRPAALYALPAERDARGEWLSPLTVVQLRGGEVRVQQATAKRAASATPPGWLIDLGDPSSGTATTLQFTWTERGAFTAPYMLQTSRDLRTWQDAGNGQLMALPSARGPLVQPEVPLPGGVMPRFVRLLWQDPATAPVLRAVTVAFAPTTGTLTDPLVTVTAAPMVTPADAPFPARQDTACFDLGGPLPVRRIDVDPGAAPRVLPLRIEGRAGTKGPWRPVAQGVSYRLLRDGQPVVSPALATDAAWRQLCVVPDERAGSAAGVSLRVQAALPRLVFAMQGTAPYRLRVGAAGATEGAMPAATLVPMLEAERGRFGQAVLGAWTEDAAVARDRHAQQRQAQWRQWALWAVLIGGVAVLGGMVWRLQKATGRR